MSHRQPSKAKYRELMMFQMLLVWGIRARTVIYYDDVLLQYSGMSVTEQAKVGSSSKSEVEIS